MRFLQSVVVSIAIVACLGTDAFGRVVPEWSFNKLLDKSEVVIIAEVASIKATRLPLSSRFPKDVYRAEDVTFRVLAVLKGIPSSGKTVRLIHYPYRLLNGKGDILSIPGGDGKRLSFERLGPVIGRSASGKLWRGEPPKYLLFLRKRADDRYEPISGQSDPALSAMKMTRAIQEFQGTQSRP